MCTGTSVGAHNAYQILVQGLDHPLQRNVLASLSGYQLQHMEPDRPDVFSGFTKNIQNEVRRALQPFGYYSPQISISRRTESGLVTLIIQVDKGDPVVVHSVAIGCTGHRCVDERLQKVFSWFPLKTGDIFDYQTYSKGKQQIITSILDLGFQNAFFQQSRVEVRPDKRTADISLTLDIGVQYYFGHITYVCGFIKERLLKRITGYREGDPFSPKALTQMRQALLATEYFSSAQVQYDLQQADKEGKVPVTIVLTPGKNNRYGVGLGYGTDTGFRGSLEWYNHRLNRYGHQLDIAWEPSERASQFGGMYTVPLGDPKKDQVHVLGDWESENYANTDRETLSAMVSYDHLKPHGEYSAYLLYVDEKYTIGSDDGQATLCAPGARISWRWVHDRIRAKHGVSVATDFSGGNKNFLSDTTFIKGAIRSKVILSFLDEYRFIGLGAVGAVVAEDLYDLPPSQRFYAGGDQSVRGYGYKQIGPEDEEGNVIGGAYLLTYSAEIERKLTDEWGVAFFYDSGTVTNNWNVLAMKQGVGTGVRWYASFGQVRLDLARTLDGSNQWRVHFSLGTDF